MMYRVFVELELPPEAVGPSTHDWVKDSFLDFGARFGDGVRCEVFMLNPVPPPGSGFEEAKRVQLAAAQSSASSMVGWYACEKCGANWLASDGPDHTCNVPKSARGWLKRIPTLGALTPLHLVVCGALLVLIGWLLGIPKKP